MITILSFVAMVTSGGTSKEKCSGMENDDDEQHLVSLSRTKYILLVKFVPENTEKNMNWAVNSMVRSSQQQFVDQCRKPGSI